MRRTPSEGGGAALTLYIVLVCAVMGAALSSRAPASAAQINEIWRGGALSSPCSLAVNPNDGSVWVADDGAHVVVHLAEDGSELWRGTGFNYPTSVSVDLSDGSCWIANRVADQVVHVAADGTELWRGGGFYRPGSVSVNQSDRSCWVADTANHQVVHLSATGSQLWRGGSFNAPPSVSVNPADGSCWVADKQNHQIVKLTSAGVELLRLSGFSFPNYVAVDTSDGSCWVANAGASEVVHLAANGTELSRTTGLNVPRTLSVDPTTGACWVANTNGNEVVALAADGTEIASRSGFTAPRGIAANTADATCWATDTGGHQVAHLELLHTLSLAGSNGVVEVDSTPHALPWSDTYQRGSSVVLEAVPDPTYEFTSWSGDLSGSENPKVITVDSDMSITATFTNIYYTLTLNGTGEGTVLVNGVERTLPWSGSFTAESVVSLEGVPGSCYEFSDWSGDLSMTENPTAITMSSAKSVTASFDKIQYLLSLTGTGSGSIVVDGTTRSLPWSGAFDCGSTVDLEADPDSCNQFTSWSGALSGSTSPTSITMDGAKSVTANFAPIMYTLSLTGVGEGSVLVDGVSRSLPWSGGVACGTTVELQAVPDACYTFGGWTGDLTGVANPKSLTMTGNKSVTANFTQLQYDLQISGTGDGSVSVDGVLRSLPWTGTFDCGDTVTLEAVPDSCWQFGNWSGDLTGSDSPDQIAIDGDKNVTANFEQIEYTLSVAGTGSGSILVDGTPHPLPWSGTFVCGSAVTVEAVPNSCYEFDSWSGDLSGDVNPRVVTMSAAKLITANFSMIQYSLNLTGDEGGTVTVEGASHALPWSGSFDCGSVVTLDASADACHEFTGWTGSITWGNSPVDVVMDGDKNIAAGFSILTYTVTISGDGEGQVSVDGVVQSLPWSDTVDCGTTLALQATPDSCWQFDGWSGDLSSSDNPVSLVVDGTKTISAGFSETEYSLSVDGAGGSVLVDGSPQSLPWSGSYICGSSVTLEAVPDEHREFAGWSGDLSGSDNPVDLVMDGDRSLVASFDWANYTLSLSAVGNGTVSVESVSQTLPWSGSFPYGTEVVLEAAPADGWKFKGWSGAISGSETAVTVTIGGDISVGATFTEIITFTDVSEDHWAYDAINACIDAGIVFGYDDGLYRPELKVSRAAMAVYIARGIAGGQENVPAGPEEPTFPDVGVDHWAYDGIEYAVAANVVTGYGDGSYQPSWTVTRAQMAAFVARAIVDPTGDEGLADYTPPAESTFTDVPTTYWCFAHVEYLAENDVVSGYADGYYRPTADVTRDQMAIYISRAFGLLTP